MPFTLPDFNLTARFYTFGTVPPAAPRIVSVCALVCARRAQEFSFGGQTQAAVSYYLLLPTGTQVRASNYTSLSDKVWLDGASRMAFFASALMIVGAGHPNEHLQLQLVQNGSWGLPVQFPTPNP
jgi:hypothetical protein